MAQNPGRRHEFPGRIFGIDPRFEAWPPSHDLLLPQRQSFACSDAQLPFDEIESGDAFGHRMFDLQPRIHLDE